MKRVVFWVLLIIFLCGLGFIAGWAYQNHINRTAERLSLKEENFIKQIILYSGEKIAKNKCEIQDESGTFIKQPLVADYLLSFVKFSFFTTKHDSVWFSCGGREKNMCGLSFGQKKSEQGWGRKLFFKYNPQTNKVNPSSFECIDIP